MPQNVCGCKYHQNVIIILEALHKKYPDAVPLYSKEDFTAKCKCDVTCEECMSNTCDQCSDFVLFRKRFQDAVVEDRVFKWYQWTEENGFPQKASMVDSTTDAFNELAKQLPKFFWHSYIKEKQSSSYSESKSDAMKLESNSCLLQMDFAENSTCLWQDEIQSAHWKQRQITIYTVMIYHHLKNATTCESSGIIFATSHGKGPNDGLGGNVKRMAHRLVMARTAIINNAETFEAAIGHCVPDIRVVVINEDKIKERVSYSHKPIDKQAIRLKYYSSATEFKDVPVYYSGAIVDADAVVDAEVYKKNDTPEEASVQNLEEINANDKPRRDQKKHDDSCGQCGVLYGDTSDPRITDDWIKCTGCRIWFHQTCAEDFGIIDDDDAFTCSHPLRQWRLSPILDCWASFSNRHRVPRVTVGMGAKFDYTAVTAYSKELGDRDLQRLSAAAPKHFSPSEKVRFMELIASSLPSESMDTATAVPPSHQKYPEKNSSALLHPKSPLQIDLFGAMRLFCCSWICDRNLTDCSPVAPSNKITHGGKCHKKDIYAPLTNATGSLGE
ncbi:hypothetical protein ScPMuIL_003636 [Solemya velum]